MSTRIELACAARRDYLPHAATMIASALANGGGPLRVHLLVGDDVEREATSALAEMVDEAGGELRVLEVDAGPFAGLKTTTVFPTAHWYRVLLPELLSVPRVLYLDCDTLVLDSLEPLWQTALGDSPLAAVTNLFPDRDGERKLLGALGVEPGGYFNSGVMLLDLEILRREGVPRQVLEFARASADRLFLPEQDAMNALLWRRRLPLAPRWNAMIGLSRLPWATEVFAPEELDAARGEPAIRHFEGSGPNKPWHSAAPTDARRLYLDFRARTPWPLRPDST